LYSYIQQLKLSVTLRNNARLCVAYHNFQYYQRVGAQRLEEFDELLQFTTGKLYLGADIPGSGLRQDILNDSILLGDIDILRVGIFVQRAIDMTEYNARYLDSLWQGLLGKYILRRLAMPLTSSERIWS
jgi:hypothetical protein